jgi:hypothetical protein
MRKLCPLVAAAAVWLAGASLPTAQAAYLSDFVNANGTSNGSSFTFDGLTFSNFTYTAAPAGVQPTSNAITVTGFTDSTNDPGIQFGGAFVPTINNPQDFQITYTVTTSATGITGVNLFGNPTVSPGSQGSLGSAQVTETVGTNNIPSLGSMQIYSRNDSGGNATLDSNSLSWSTPYHSINVTKDILVYNQTGQASISIIDQSYAVFPAPPPPQTPEPSSVVLIGLGGLGLIGYSLKRRRSPRA